MTGARQEKRITQASVSATVEEASNGTIKTVVKKSKVTVARANGVKKVFSLPGQKYEPPEERDPLRVFYESLHEQIPSSEMAELWLLEHGLLSPDDARKAFDKKLSRGKLGTPVKASVKAEAPGSGSRGKVTAVKTEVKREVKAEVKTQVKAEASTNGAKRKAAPAPKAKRKLDDSDSDDDFIAARKAKVKRRE